MVDVPQIQLNPALQNIINANINNGGSGSSITSYLWVVYILLILVGIMGIIFSTIYLIRLFSRKRENNFLDLLAKGNSALNTRDLETAKNIYSKLKSIAETTKDPELRSLALGFYNKLMEAMRK